MGGAKWGNGVERTKVGLEGGELANVYSRVDVYEPSRLPCGAPGLSSPFQWNRDDIWKKGRNVANVLDTGGAWVKLPKIKGMAPARKAADRMRPREGSLDPDCADSRFHRYENQIAIPMRVEDANGHCHKRNRLEHPSPA